MLRNSRVLKRRSRQSGEQAELADPNFVRQESRDQEERMFGALHLKGLWAQLVAIPRFFVSNAWRATYPI